MSSADLAAIAAPVDLVRDEADRHGVLAASMTFRTADGEVDVDYRAGDWLRITFRGDGPERTHVLPPDWQP